MNDKEFWVDQGSNYFNDEGANSNVHAIDVGIYRGQDGHEEPIAITYCLKVAWYDRGDMGKYTRNDWMDLISDAGAYCMVCTKEIERRYKNE